MHKRSVCYGKFRAHRRNPWKRSSWRDWKRTEQGFLFRFLFRLFDRLKGFLRLIVEFLWKFVEFFQPLFRLFFQQPKFQFFVWFVFLFVQPQL